MGSPIIFVSRDEAIYIEPIQWGALARLGLVLASAVFPWVVLCLGQ